MIQVENLAKTFVTYRKEAGLRGSLRALFRREAVVRHAVSGVSLSVGEGEIVGLVGPNGAGKTTLVKMLAGIVHPSSGDARVLGYRPWERDNRLRRQIALIMGQKAQLWWDLPAGDSFLLLKDIYRLPEPEYRSSLDELSSTLGVTDLLSIPLRRLSLGERMKMELVAALLHKPRVVFLDEPTIGLDVTAQRAIRDFLLEYRERHKPAMILTSHYMEDIARLCRRIVIIRDGAFVYDGPIEQVVRRYAPEKVLTAILDLGPGDPVPQIGAELPGRVIEASRDRIRVAVPRDRVTQAAQRLLSHLPIADLTIEETDIGDVVERIFKEKGGGEPA
jgi:ABC-2 type transport system ATP-binding protein